jgi:hypothetical protein
MGGKKQAQPKQSLFLIYVDALSVVNSKSAAKALQAQQHAQLQDATRALSQLSTAAPNMPDFTLKDLQFILTFTGAEAMMMMNCPAVACVTPRAGRCLGWT